MPLASDVNIKLSNNTSMPALGMGTALPPEQLAATKEAIIAAVKAGMRHIDTAWYYGTEKEIGYALEELFAEEVVTREDLFITTKVWPLMHDKVEQLLQQLLDDLGLDYVDMFMQHWPIAFKLGPDGTPAVPTAADGLLEFDPNGLYLKTYKQVEALYQHTDKVKAIGVCNYLEEMLAKLVGEVSVIPMANQIELHPRLPLDGLVALCKQHDIVVVAYLPLGSEGAPLIKEPLVQELAAKYLVQPAEVLTSYHIVEGRAVIPRSTNPKRMAQMVHLAELSPEDLQRLHQWGKDSPHRFIRDPWGKELGFPYW